MAKDNNGLSLPLRVDLTEFERGLLTADEDLQKVMRKMRSQTSDFKLRYDVEIANARAAGDTTRALELENRKLNGVFEAQKKIVNDLNAAYKKSLEEKGANARETKALATQLVRESNALERTRKQLESKNLNLGATLSNGLANVSPAFARVRDVVSQTTSSLGEMGTAGVTAAKAVAGVGVGVAAVAAAAGAMEKIVGYVERLGNAAADANDKVFQLREELETTYDNAENLYGVLSIDGVGVEAYAQAMNKLNKQLLNAGENGNLASDMLQRWNVELRNGDGTRKDAIEQLRELAAGYKRAQQAGEGQDFLTATGTTRLVHVLNDLDGYLAKWQAIRVEYERNHQLSHDLVEGRAREKIAEEQLNAVRGDVALRAANEVLQRRIDAMVMEAQIVADNKAAYEEYHKTLSSLANSWTEIKLTASIALDSMFMDIVKVTDELKMFKEAMGVMLESFGKASPVLRLRDSIKDLTGFDIASFSPVYALTEQIGKWWDDASAKVDEYRLKQKDVADDAVELAELSEMELNRSNSGPRDVQGERERSKREAEELKKRKAAQEQFNKELRDLQSTEYEREINRLNERVEEWRKAKISEVDIAQRVAIEKEAIDKRYYEKQAAARDKELKSVENSYAKQIEAAKKARESSISAAESTLKSNLQLVRYIRRNQQAGTYDEDKAKEYAQRLYMRQAGFRQSDVDTLRNIGTEKLADIANARDRVFGSFANQQGVTNNNTVTVNNNFDGTVVEDMSAMDKLANRVAELMIPTIQQALRGGGEYGY